ncbi:MAG: DeoR/GlpR transcriptional regulator [Ruminococcaceae bacterium]|nr:DeoR/GlpR transcriptional regulator [Oscillospiraceae bacterium]
MLPIERKNEILSKLMLDGKVIVSDLALFYNVTEETIRRDLEKLEREGFAKKTYGGAVKSDNMTAELPYTVRKLTNVSGKKYIAEKIGNLIQDGDSIMLDASTTALFTVKSIFSKHNLTLITNSVEILLDLPASNDWRVISTGGAYSQDSMSFLSSSAISAVSNYHADYAVMSCKGLDIEKGITDTRENNAHLKKCFLKSANKIVLAVDNTKFDKVSFVKICELEDIDIIVTDAKPSADCIKEFERKNIELIY